MNTHRRKAAATRYALRILKDIANHSSYGKDQMNILVKSISLCAALAAAGGAEAQELIGFKIEPNRANMVYACGEEAVFTATATNGAGARVTSGRVQVSVDDYTKKPKQTREVDLARENPFVIRETLAEPGFLRIALSGDGVRRTLRGAGFSPERIRAIGTCPADFDSFWSESRARLAREVPLDPQLEFVPERSTRTFDFWRVSFATFGGQRVWGFLTVPKDKSKAPFPVRFMISSAGQGRWTWDFECARNQDRYINMSFTIHAFKPPTNQPDADRLHKQLREDLKAKYGVSCYYSAAGLGKSREDGYFYRPILGIDRAVDWLWARPDVDRRHFFYRGGSQAGGLGMILVALNHKFTGAFLNVPAMMDVLGSTGGRVDTFPYVGQYAGHPTHATALRNAAYFNGAFFAPRVTCPIRFALGFIDETCPPTGVYAAYNALTVKDKDVCHGLLRGHGGWPEADVFEKWIDDQCRR